MVADETCTGCVFDGPHAARMRPFCLVDCLTACEMDVLAEGNDFYAEVTTPVKLR